MFAVDSSGPVGLSDEIKLSQLRVRLEYGHVCLTGCDDDNWIKSPHSPPRHWRTPGELRPTTNVNRDKRV